MMLSRNPNDSLQASAEMLEASAATGMHLLTITCEAPGEFLQALVLTSFLPPEGSKIYLENLAPMTVTGITFAVKSGKGVKFLQAFVSAIPAQERPVA